MKRKLIQGIDKLVRLFRVLNVCFIEQLGKENNI